MSQLHGRPLLISDCDEVILHFVTHFAQWVEEAADLVFALDTPGFAGALRSRDGQLVPEERVWPLLEMFFDGEMHRQNIVPGAAEALAEIARHADIVILTNIGDAYEANRVAQLEAFDIKHRVLCNRGGKGRPVSELIESMRPSATVFIDDLSVHHESVANHAPDVWRLQMIAEPRLAASTPPAEHAHARIDDWKEALPWILARLTGQEPGGDEDRRP
ncbi:HAD family hydrolase [Sphingosinicella terrae]|uniref:HAD family hydrolase n=1 Tax=Sphingosinicella terrae TaxID=2172047 RepID=UPI000E0CDC95|nr:HAD family hydrolase [Sphingosinicella terrae]